MSLGGKPQGLLGKLTEGIDLSLYTSQKLSTMKTSQSIYADCLIGTVMKQGMLDRLTEHTDLCENNCRRNRTQTLSAPKKVQFVSKNVSSLRQAIDSIVNRRDDTSGNNSKRDQQQSKVSMPFESDPLESSSSSSSVIDDEHGEVIEEFLTENQHGAVNHETVIKNEYGAVNDETVFENEHGAVNDETVFENEHGAVNYETISANQDPHCRVVVESLPCIIRELGIDKEM
ncbi:hypothetical protein WDU94_000111 [Cyamophila willieti]